ncbi:hypothetical protein KCV07_g2281, partial [Aureobasidium melanogenum]
MQRITAPSHGPNIPAHINGNQFCILDTPFSTKVSNVSDYGRPVHDCGFGLGIQLAQGLKKYADSALDSKGRILAISTDIELAVQVINTLDATLQNTSSRASMTNDAKRLTKDVIKQRQDLFAAIKAILLDLSPIGIKKMDMVKWPTIESKVELMRSNFEKIKITMQLLISVMIYAAISSSTIQTESIANQRLEIRRLQEEEAAAEARLVTLTLQYDELLARSQPQDQNLGSSSSRVSKPMHCIEGGNIPKTNPGHDTSPQNGCQPRHQAPSISSRILPARLRKSNISASKKSEDKYPNSPLASKRRKRDYITKFGGPTRQRASALPSPTESEFEDSMQILFKDYVRCVDQLMMLRAVIQLATDITFDFEGDRAYGRRGAALTFELIEKVKWHGESTLHCLKACLMDSAAVRVIEQPAEASRSDFQEMLSIKRPTPNF